MTPVIKKPWIREASPSPYRPISNLFVMFKFLESLVARQFVTYLNTACLLSTTQSSFRRRHSTETAMIRVLSDILFLDAVDRYTLPLSSYSTSLRHLTPRTTEFCCRGCELPLVLTTQHWRGFALTCTVENSMFVVAANAVILLTSSVVFHNNRSEDR